MNCEMDCLSVLFKEKFVSGVKYISLINVLRHY